MRYVSGYLKGSYLCVLEAVVFVNVAFLTVVAPGLLCGFQTRIPIYSKGLIFNIWVSVSLDRRLSPSLSARGRMLSYL